MKTILVFLIFYLQLYANNTLYNANQALKNKQYQKAKQLYLKASKQNNAQAQYKLGLLYFKGEKGFSKSYTKTYVYLTKASLNGYKKASYALGNFYANKKTPYFDYKKAFSIFLDLANQGYAPAENKVGLFYLFAFDSSIEKNYKKAVAFFEKASKQKFQEANCNLAYMYANGKGVWTNFGRAHAFAKKGVQLKLPMCIQVWKDFNLQNYPHDKAWKFNFYTKPVE